MKSPKFLLVFFLIVFLFIAFNFAVAQNVPPQPGGGSAGGSALITEVAQQTGYAAMTSGLSSNDPRYIAVTLIKVALGLLGTIFFAQIVYAGYMWMTAGGDSKKVETAQKYIKNGVIGLVIILASYGIVLLVTVYVLRGTTYDHLNPYQLPPGYPQY